MRILPADRVTSVVICLFSIQNTILYIIRRTFSIIYLRMNTCTMWKVVFSLVLTISSAYTQNYDINITLSDYNATNIFINKTVLEPNSKFVINVLKDESLEFFVIQVHSFIVNTVISTTSNFLSDASVNGTNIGLVQVLNGATNYVFYVKNENLVNSTILIAVIPYSHAPVPGGCNMEFNTEIAPYQHISYTDELITVDAQAASIGGRCSIVQHDLYHFFLTKADFSIASYFNAIENMLTVNDVKNHGTKVATTMTWLRKLYNNYKGVGSVYAVVATYKNLSSAYVPIVSYGCDLDLGCFDTSTSFITVLQYIAGFLGLFLCFCGHSCYQIQFFLFGCLAAGFTSYVILSSISAESAIFVSPIVGCIFGLVCILFWRCFKSFVLSNLLTVFALGFLLASTIFYSGLNDLTIVHNDLTYWGFFSSIVFLTMIALTSLAHSGNILACAIVGSFAFVSFLCRFTTPGLEYIFITTIRRATVHGANIAVFDPPYQSFDTKLVVVWLIVALAGQWYQRYVKSHSDETTSPSWCSQMCNELRMWCQLRTLNQYAPPDSQDDEHSPLLGQPQRIIVIHSIRSPEMI